MPSLRRYYTHLIGVDFSLSDLRELDATFEPPHGLSGLALDTLQACDHWFLASDESISGRIQLSAEERSFEFTNAIGSIAKRQFAKFGAHA